MVKASPGKMGPRTDPEAIERRRMQNRLAQRKRRLKRAQMAREEKERQQRLQAAQAASQLTFINDGYHLQMNQTTPVLPQNEQKTVPSTMNSYYDYTSSPHLEDVFASSPYFPQTPSQSFEDPSYFVSGYPSPSLSYVSSTPPLSIYTPSLIDEEISAGGSISSTVNHTSTDIDPNLFISSSGVISSAGAGAGKGHPFDAFGLMPLQPIQHSPRLQPDRHRSTSLPTPFTPPRSVPNLSSPPTSAATRTRAPSTSVLGDIKGSGLNNKNININNNGLTPPPFAHHTRSITSSPNLSAPLPTTASSHAILNMNLNGIPSASSSPNIPSHVSSGKTGLHVCAEQGNTHVVQLLLSYGADINTMDEYGRTPLHYAVQNNHLELVKVLVERGAMATIADIHGKNPMHLAAESGSQDMMQMMVMMTASPTTAAPPMMIPVGQDNINLHNGLISSA